MDLDEIKELMAAFAASDLAEMHLTRGEWTLHLVRAADGSVAPAAPAPARVRPSVARPAAAAPAADGGVRAPLAGLVYLNANPGTPPFVSVGARVEAGTVVAVIEAMKVFNEIRAERAGTVEAILVASGDEVDAGQLLMRIG
jgi:acetyl-CoA carboxylase biotin carboxyl carrier protein